MPTICSFNHSIKETKTARVKKQRIYRIRNRLHSYTIITNIKGGVKMIYICNTETQVIGVVLLRCVLFYNRISQDHRLKWFIKTYLLNLWGCREFWSQQVFPLLRIITNSFIIISKNFLMLPVIT